MSLPNHGLLLCAKDVAAILRVNPRAAAGLLARGEIAGFKLSGQVWRTTRAEVDAYISREMARWHSIRRRPAA